jgi:hypothetical protein
MILEMRKPLAAGDDPSKILDRKGGEASVQADLGDVGEPVRPEILAFPRRKHNEVPLECCK